MKVLIKPARNKKFVWEFIAKNGRITGNNETFATRANAVRAAKAVITQIFKGFATPEYELVFRPLAEGTQKGSFVLLFSAVRKPDSAPID